MGDLIEGPTPWAPPSISKSFNDAAAGKYTGGRKPRIVISDGAGITIIGPVDESPAPQAKPEPDPEKITLLDAYAPPAKGVGKISQPLSEPEDAPGTDDLPRVKGATLKSMMNMPSIAYGSSRGPVNDGGMA